MCRVILELLSVLAFLWFNALTYSVIILIFLANYNNSFLPTFFFQMDCVLKTPFLCLYACGYEWGGVSVNVGVNVWSIYGN